MLAAKCRVKHLQCEQPALSSENFHRFSKMPHTNRAELTRLFANFCHFWTKGLHTNVQMKTMGSGGVLAQFASWSPEECAQCARKSLQSAIGMNGLLGVALCKHCTWRKLQSEGHFKCPNRRASGASKINKSNPPSWNFVSIAKSSQSSKLLLCIVSCFACQLGRFNLPDNCPESDNKNREKKRATNNHTENKR